MTIRGSRLVSRESDQVIFEPEATMSGPIMTIRDDLIVIWWLPMT
jgi:hypothetical protein